MKRYLCKVKLMSSSQLNTIFVLHRYLGLSISTCLEIRQLPLGIEVELLKNLGLKSEDPKLLIKSDKTTDELIELCEKRDIIIKINVVK